MRIEPLKKMSGLNEWAKGKPVGLVIMAQQFAVGAEACFEFLKLASVNENRYPHF